MNTHIIISLGLLLTLSTFGVSQPFNGFVKFDGYDDALYIPSSEVLSKKSDFTIEFWFKTCNDSNFVQEALLGIGSNVELNFFTITDSTQTIVYQRCATTTKNIYHCNQNHQFPLDEEWHHLALTYNQYTYKLVLYFDGIPGPYDVDEEYEPVFYDSLFIGRSGYHSWLYDHFDGSMDEVRISNIVRYTSAFIPDTSEFTVDSNTVALWHMNDTASQDFVHDSSGNNHHLSVIQNPHILWPIDSQERASSLLEHSGNRESRAQPYSRCPVPTNGFDIYILVETEDTITGVAISETNQGLSKLQIGPNPSSNHIRILQSNQNVNGYKILDMHGRWVGNGEFNNQTSTIDISRLARGIYILQIESGSEIHNLRFQKI